MSDDTSVPAHRAEDTPSRLKNITDGTKATLDRPHINNATLHKTVDTLQDVQARTLTLLETVVKKLDTASEDATAAREKAEAALKEHETSGFPQDPATVRALRHHVAVTKAQQEKIATFATSADGIRMEAESENRRKRRLAEGDAADLGDEIDEVLADFRRDIKAVDKKVDDVRKELDKRITDETERLDGRIDEERDKVADRFEKEVAPLAGKTDLTAKMQGDLASMRQVTDRHTKVLDQRQSLVPLGIGALVGFFMFLIALAVTALNFPFAFVFGLGFFSLTAGLIYVITGHRQKTVETKTETRDSREESEDKPGAVDKLRSMFDASRTSKDRERDGDADDTDTRPVERVTEKETVREAEPARSRR